MVKKLLTGLMCMVILFAAAGCASILEDEYSVVTPHEIRPSPQKNDTDEIREANDYDSFKTSMLDLISVGRSEAIIRCTAYNGKIEDDISKVCMEIINDDPLGAYAVSYVDYSLNKIVSYYEVKLSFTYKKSVEEIISVKQVNSGAELEEELLYAASQHKPSIVVRTDAYMASADTVNDILERVYYKNPDKLFCLPQAAVKAYPEEGQNRIAEIVFIYSYSKAIHDQNKAYVDEKVSKILMNTGDFSGDELIRYLCNEIASYTEYVNEADLMIQYDRRNEIYTVVGALGNGRSASEGLAMSLKLLCNKLNIECDVVQGVKNNADYSWNLIKLENGAYYHIDIADYMQSGMLIKNDSEMSSEYRWDTTHVQPCDGESLN